MVRSSKPRLDGEVDRLRPFAGFDFLAAVGLHARDLEAAVGADDGEAVVLDRDDLAQLAGDATAFTDRYAVDVSRAIFFPRQGPGAPMLSAAS